MVQQRVARLTGGTLQVALSVDLSPLKLCTMEQAILRQVAGKRYVPATDILTLNAAEHVTGTDNQMQTNAQRFRSQLRASQRVTIWRNCILKPRTWWLKYADWLWKWPPTRTLTQPT